MLKGIREVTTHKDANGEYDRVRVKFGPHHILELKSDPAGRVSFDLRATHHGFKADASEPNGELEQIINRIGGDFPGNAVD